MMYKEIRLFDIKHFSNKVNYVLTDNANHFNNDLYILSEGNHFDFDDITLQALKNLAKRIEKTIDKLEQK